MDTRDIARRFRLPLLLTLGVMVHRTIGSDLVASGDLARAREGRRMDRILPRASVTTAPEVGAGA